MIKYLKKLLNLDNPTTMSDAEYKEFNKKIVDALLEQKEVLIKVNDVPYIVSKEPGFFGKIVLTKVENKHL